MMPGALEKHFRSYGVTFKAPDQEATVGKLAAVDRDEEVRFAHSQIRPLNDFIFKTLSWVGGKKSLDCCVLHGHLTHVHASQELAMANVVQGEGGSLADLLADQSLPEGMPQMAAPSSVKTPLLEHQRIALAWMVSREQSGRRPLFWVRPCMLNPMEFLFKSRELLCLAKI
jgi:hypothetical protein